MPTPHKHAEVIRAYADGTQIEVKRDGGNWIATPRPDFDEDLEYRVKPAAPKWPQTTMSGNMLEVIYMGTSSDNRNADFIAIANAALAHACETGALVPADKVREIEAKARVEGAKSALDPIDVIEATWRHLKSFPVSREDIQIILLKAAK